MNTSYSPFEQYTYVHIRIKDGSGLVTQNLGRVGSGYSETMARGQNFRPGFGLTQPYVGIYNEPVFLVLQVGVTS